MIIGFICLAFSLISGGAAIFSDDDDKRKYAIAICIIFLVVALIFLQEFIP